MYKCIECGKILAFCDTKRCRKCYLKNPDRGYSHNFSKSELKRRAKSMSKNRKNGTVRTWNKNKNLWKERPELVLQMKKTLKGKRCNPKGEFKKGHKKSLKKRGDLINRHHIDLNNKNNHPTNLKYLTNSKHNQLHKRAYDYLVKIKKIKNYMNWFIKIYKPKLYTVKEYKSINKTIAKQ